MNENRSEVFFYADKDADLYDEVAPLVEPRYEFLHRMLTLLVLDHLQRAESVSTVFRVLDLGPGTGRELTSLAAAVSKPLHVTCIEISAEMGALLNSRMGAVGESVDCRIGVEVVMGDYFSPSVRSAVVGKFDLALSAFSLHHGDEDQKRWLYRWLHQKLRTNSLFVNADLLAFDSPELGVKANEYLEGHIARALAAGPENLRGRLADYSPNQINELHQRWIEHIRNENRELPFEGGSNSGEGTMGERDLLLQAGFRVVELPVRILGAGIVWAVS